ncbi:MAG: IS607 family transposase [Actinomycetia bacterium]|nr:IS607 family transposase [Actinomycetes bacterium]
MKLSVYAKKLGISYQTAWRWWKAGTIPGAYQLPTGTVIVPEEKSLELPDKAAIYARVSSSENRDNLDWQAERLEEYCMARGYRIARVVKEVGSGVNDNRRKLEKLVTDKSYNRLVVEHKDRLTRFGFNYLKLLMGEQGKIIEIVNEAEDGKEDLMADFISIITSFCARLYGLGRSKRKTEKIIEELKDGGKKA